MSARISYEFKSPQSIKIIEKILEIQVVEVDFDGKLLLSCPEVSYWSYRLYLGESDMPSNELTKPEFTFASSISSGLCQLQVAVIDTDDGSEICRVLINKSL